MTLDLDINLPWLVAFVLNELPTQSDLDPLKARLRVLEDQRAGAEETLKALEPTREGTIAWLAQFLLGSDRVLSLLLHEIRVAAQMRDLLRGLE